MVFPLVGLAGFLATNSLDNASKSFGPKDGSLILGASSLSFEGRRRFTIATTVKSKLKMMMMMSKDDGCYIERETYGPVVCRCQGTMSA